MTAIQGYSSNNAADLQRAGTPSPGANTVGAASAETSASAAAPDSTESPAVTLSLSPQAQASLLAPSSALQDFPTVARNARTTVDADYAKLGMTTGDIYTTFSRWQTIFGTLDRRSLYAIASNAGTQFTAVERDAAKSFMTSQESAAMGIADGMPRDPTAAFKAAIDFLDGVSPEEKASFDWAKERASAQFNYELSMQRDGGVPDKVDSENPIVKMILSGLNALKALGDPSRQLEDMPQYRQAQQYFQSGPTSGSGNLLDVSA